MPKMGTDWGVSQRVTLESTDPDYGDCFRSQFCLARYSLRVILILVVSILWKEIPAVIRKEEWDEKNFDNLVHYLVHVDGLATID